ncbi:hypothetical protein [Wolbachia endosymbiont of Onchocerca ochengi]|uniref:hypothetical protein n=1 Tax=Wolbachia endosymbiont of Onchocerca ochengi TaxID=100901 RepID=UPI0034E05E79
MRRYFYLKGEEKRYRIITIEGGFHGRSIAAISAEEARNYAKASLRSFLVSIKCQEMTSKSTREKDQ